MVRRTLTGNTQSLRVQHDQLQAELATRQSIAHFAHAAVSLVFAGIFAGVAGKFFLGGEDELAFAIAVGSFVAGLVLYALVRMVAGRRRYVVEKSAFERLKALRRELQADDPAAYLPR